MSILTITPARQHKSIGKTEGMKKEDPGSAVGSVQTFDSMYEVILAENMSNFMCNNGGSKPENARVLNIEYVLHQRWQDIQCVPRMMLLSRDFKVMPPTSLLSPHQLLPELLRELVHT